MEQKIKPFLRWAGGKSWLVKHVASIIERSAFRNYHEPFLGGGAIFFSLPRDDKKYYLSDLNVDLIKTYRGVKSHVDEVIEELELYRNTKAFYYKKRSEEESDLVKHTARFIYLNQTSFNGIYRVNLEGKYNVPFGFRKKHFLDAENLKLVSKQLKNTKIFKGDFESLKENLSSKDLVFLDPPYTVSHNLNGFIKYNQKLFSLEDQYRLSDLIDYIKSKNAYYILTNAAHFKIKEIFDKDDRRLELFRSSVVGGDSAKRGITSELIFTNIVK